MLEPIGSLRSCGVRDNDSSEPGKPVSRELELSSSARRFARRSDKPEGVGVWCRGIRFGLAVSSRIDLNEEDMFPGGSWYWDMVGDILGAWASVL